MLVKYVGVKDADSPYPILLINLDGARARVSLEQKHGLVKQGLIFLGNDWLDKVAPIYLPPDPADGRMHGLELRGFSNDPEVARLYTEFQDQFGVVGAG